MTIYQLLLLWLRSKIKKNYTCEHSFGKVELETGLQYCTKCGISKFIKIDCTHIFVIKDSFEISKNNTVVEYKYSLQCKKCGDLVERSFKSCQ